jgi:UDP-N-acetylmuramate dehydrogenase
VIAIDELVEIGGARVSEHAPLGRRTTYRVGGSVRLLVELGSRADLDELGPLLLATALPIVAVGNGSNLLVNDGEHDALVVTFTGELATLTWSDEGSDVIVRGGAGFALPVAARRLSGDGVVGFEWAVGVPGSFGGAVAMNAGGHGADLAESIVEAQVWRDGVVEAWSKERLALGYRTSALLDGDLVLEATLRLSRGDAVGAEGRVRDIVRWRREHQPGGANAGSVFRNPLDDHAARLIEEAGAKGLRYESASVSEKHTNFIQADDGGRASDVYVLMGLVRDLVREKTGVELVSENRLLGFEDAP